MKETIRKLQIFTDGGARGNPGPAGIGVVISETGKVIKKISRYLGEKTNNEAEYEALICGLQAAVELGAQEVDFFADSELLVRQLNNIYRAKTAHIQQLIIRVRNLEQAFNRVRYSHVPREKNQLADDLVNRAIDEAVS